AAKMRVGVYRQGTDVDEAPHVSRHGHGIEQVPRGHRGIQEAPGKGLFDSSGEMIYDHHSVHRFGAHISREQVAANHLYTIAAELRTNAIQVRRDARPPRKAPNLGETSSQKGPNNPGAYKAVRARYKDLILRSGDQLRSIALNRESNGRLGRS